MLFRSNQYTHDEGMQKVKTFTSKEQMISSFNDTTSNQDPVIDIQFEYWMVDKRNGWKTYLVKTLTKGSPWLTVGFSNSDSF